MIFVLMNPISYISCFLHSTIFNLHNIVRIINYKYTQWKSRAIYRDLMTEIVLTDSSKRPLVYRGVLIEEREELIKWNSQQIICNEIVLLFNMQIQSIRTLRLSAGFHVPIMESSHNCCQRFFIFDERLPVLVSLYLHLHGFIMYFVGQVICKIAITGHHPRIIIDVVARHLERGARLLRLFAELGNLFPSSSFFQPLITDSTSRPLRFDKWICNNVLIVAFRRRLC